MRIGDGREVLALRHAAGARSFVLIHCGATRSSSDLPQELARLCLRERSADHVFRDASRRLGVEGVTFGERVGRQIRIGDL